MVDKVIAYLYDAPLYSIFHFLGVSETIKPPS